MLKVEKRKEGKKMQWQFVVALVVAVPIILLPAVFVWYLNLGGILINFKEARKAKRAAILHTI